MWSRSQARESRRQPGKTQWPSRRTTSSRIAAGGSCWSTAWSLARSRTGRTMSLPPALAWRVSQPVRRSVVAAPSFSIATAPVPSRSSGVRWRNRFMAPAPGGGCGAVAAGHEVEGVLGVGEDPDCTCPADVDGVSVAEFLEVSGDAADGLVEQQGVGGVEGHDHVGGGGVAAVLDPDTTAGEFVFLVGDGTVGVEVEPRFLDQTSGVDLTDLVRSGGRSTGRRTRRRPGRGRGSRGRSRGPPRPAPARTRPVVGGGGVGR